MSQIMLRPAFKAAQSSQGQTPAAFFQCCRRTARSSISRQDRSLHTRRLQSGQAPALAPSHRFELRRQRTHEWQLRQFSKTAPARATVTRMNPRKDDEGNEMTIEISENAAKQLRALTSKPARRNTLTQSSSSSPDHHIRITVTSGGCHGFSYLMNAESEEKIDQEEDTIFEYPTDSAEGQGLAQVVIDEASLELLKGSTLDYTRELIGSQFKIVGNPRAKSSCGCGTSFDID